MENDADVSCKPLMTGQLRIARSLTLKPSYGVTENVLRCDACTVTTQDKDVTPQDKVSLKSILNN